MPALSCLCGAMSSPRDPDSIAGDARGRAVAPDPSVAYATGGATRRRHDFDKGDLRMPELADTAVTRRGFLKTGALAAAAPLLLADVPFAAAQSPARNVSKVHDFQTSADV